MVRDLGLGFGSQISAMVVFEGKVSGVAVVRGEGGECPKFDRGGAAPQHAVEQSPVVSIARRSDGGVVSAESFNFRTTSRDR